MVHLKSAREIDLMRAAADLVGRALAEVARHVRPGVTTLELDEIAEDYIRTRGGDPAFKGYQIAADVPPFPGTLCTSVDDVVVHGIPNDRPLEEGELLSVDCGAKLNGYFGDYAYTFAVGEISEEKAQLCRVTHEAMHRGIHQAAAGQRLGDIGYAVQHYCEEHGYGVVRDLVGHGIGRDLHEDPQVPNHGKRRRGRKLRQGLTICIEPMINRGTYEVVSDPDGWTIRTADGQPSAHYEHTVVVRKDGPDVISTYSYIEEVIEAPYKQATVHG